MYKFTEDCRIHIDSIDREHEYLFKLINDAISAQHETEDITILANSVIVRLKEYAATHFLHEEEYMKSIHDPELMLQQREHAAFTAKMNDFSMEGLSADEAEKAFNDLMQYLAHWLHRHILSSDRMIGQMVNGNPFAFTEKYKTGIEMIDEEHRRLFEIIQETDSVIHNVNLHDKYDEIVKLLKELKDYTEIHFRDEEEYMKNIRFPGLEAQQRAHTAFIERLVEIDLEGFDTIDDNQDEYLVNLIQFLLNWLSNHILGADKRIGDYVQSGGAD